MKCPCTSPESMYSARDANVAIGGHRSALARADEARMRASRAFWDRALEHSLGQRPREVAAPVVLSGHENAATGRLGLSNRMYVTVSAVLLAIAAGARMQLQGKALKDLHSTSNLFDPPFDLVAALSPPSAPALPSAPPATVVQGKGHTSRAYRIPQLLLSHRVSTSASWLRLLRWQPHLGLAPLLPPSQARPGVAFPAAPPACRDREGECYVLEVASNRALRVGLDPTTSVALLWPLWPVLCCLCDAAVLVTQYCGLTVALLWHYCGITVTRTLFVLTRLRPSHIPRSQSGLRHSC